LFLINICVNYELKMI